jgi:hypothetical protein
MEGSVGRIFRSSVQPAEIGRKLERAMIQNQVVTVEGKLVPNDYRVELHPEDLAQFADYISGLTRQLEDWLTQVIAARGLIVVDRVRVHLAGNDKLPRRSIAITATILDRPDFTQEAQDRVQRTEIYRVVREVSDIPPLLLEILNGPRQGDEIILRKPVTTVGRALDNDIVFESGDVSRHHARFEFINGRMLVVDQRSTNGTRVNGQLVHSHIIGPGDNISFGTVTVRVHTVDPYEAIGIPQP